MAYDRTSIMPYIYGIYMEMCGRFLKCHKNSHKSIEIFTCSLLEFGSKWNMIMSQLVRFYNHRETPRIFEQVRD